MPATYHFARRRSTIRPTIATTTKPTRITNQALPIPPVMGALQVARIAVAAETAAKTPQPGVDGAGTGCVSPGFRTVATTDVHSHAIAAAKMITRMSNHGAPNTIAAIATGRSTAADRVRFWRLVRAPGASP